MLSIPKFYWITTIAFVLAALMAMTPFGQGAQIFFLVSLIGIPIAMLISVLPTIALYLVFGLPALLLASLFVKSDGKRWLLALVLALMMGIVPAQLANLSLPRRSAELLAEDRGVSASFNFTSPAIWYSGPTQRSKAQRCDRVCLHLLLFAGAERVLLLTSDVSAGVPKPQSAIPVFWFEEGSNCTSTALINTESDPEFDPGLHLTSDASPAELVQTEMDKGRCLRVGRAPLAEADAILMSAMLSDGHELKSQPLRVNADTLTIHRMSLYRRNGSEFVETARQTFVSSYRHPLRLMPVLTPPMIGSGKEGRLMFDRRFTSSRIGTNRYFRPSFVAFLVKDLGLRL